MRVTAFCRISYASFSLALIKSSTTNFLCFPVHAFASRTFHDPASAISLSVPSSPWWKKASMAFTSAFHSAFNVNRKGTVSCYSPPSGCNAALKIPWLQSDTVSAHPCPCPRCLCHPRHLGSLCGRRLQLHFCLLQPQNCLQHEWK